MVKGESDLKFIKYDVDEIIFKNNKECQNFKGEVSISFEKNIEIKENLALVSLSCLIFKDSIANCYPFEFNIKITGHFDILKVKKEIVYEILNNNCLAIMFPYLRAIVSSYTALANVNCLILPAVNIANMFVEN